jgi:hypothetical protein
MVMDQWVWRPSISSSKVPRKTSSQLIINYMVTCITSISKSLTSTIHGLTKTGATADLGVQKQQQRVLCSLLYTTATVATSSSVQCLIYLGEVSLLVSLDESPLTNSWNASTFTGGTRMPYEFLQPSGCQGMEEMTTQKQRRN